MLEIWLAFSAGLAGSGHCLGMCGGIVTALSLCRSNSNAVQRFLYNLFYHLGRVCTYATLGFVAGFISQAGFVEVLKPYFAWLFLLANLFVTAIGVFTAIGVRSLGIAALDGTGWGILNRLLSRQAERVSLFSALPTGLLMGLLPCGLVYGIMLSAATSGSAVKGGGMMLAFGIGTLPALLAYGQFASGLSSLGRGAFQRVMGIIVALLGVVGVWKALVKTGIL